ncbi:MAG: hypothetical protein KDD22_05755 [Bdellovibrionales bacterium]|nr:hypothetical protein [Bdellovibrionales bacterium]
MKWIIFISLSLATVQTHAVARITIHGTLKGFDHKIIQIETQNQIVKVPRHSAKVPLKGLQVGVATIQAQLTLDEMMKLNGNPFKKVSKK